MRPASLWVDIVKNQRSLPSHLKVIFRDCLNTNQRIDSNIAPLEHAMIWLKKAQDADDAGGVSAGYSFIYGWRPSYPETTGYIIPTFLNYYHLHKNEEYLQRAIKMADWLIRIQSEDGYIKGISRTAQAKPMVFDTGQVLQGLIRIYKEVGQEKYLQAAFKAANWLVKVQDVDGAWRKFEYNGISHVYDTRVAWPLLEMSQLTSDAIYLTSSIKNIEWALNNQEANGWFRNNAFDTRKQPILHTIAYAIEGLLESADLTRNNRWLDKVMISAEALRKIFETKGNLSGAYNKDWKGTIKDRCLTGEAQMSLCWSRLFQISNDKDFLNAALNMNNKLKIFQDTNSANTGINGGLKGSHPIWGSYQPFSYPIWGVKFFADALMMERLFRAE